MHRKIAVRGRCVVGAFAAALALFAATAAGAVTLVDLKLSATARPYGPDNPVVSQRQEFSVPNQKGIVVMTFTEDHYVGGPGGFAVDPKDLSNDHLGWNGSTEYTPHDPIKGQPYRVQTIWRTDFSKKVWVATLTARHEYQAYQVRHLGRQIASTQQLTIEFIPGDAATPPSAPPPAPVPGALPQGRDQFDSTSLLKGDPFNGGSWANAKNGSATASRDLDHAVCISGLNLQSAGSDMTTRDASIKIVLSGPSGSRVALDVRDAAINRQFSPGGSGNVLPPQTASFAPFETTRVEVQMTGSGWFMLNGLTFSFAPCP